MLAVKKSIIQDHTKTFEMGAGVDWTAIYVKSNR